jgi:4-hydroxy-tetrahydrodipicolinate synthase
MNIQKDLIQGTITALATPFTADGASIDYSSLENLFGFQVDSGIKSFVVCGSTGEAAMLSDDEYKSLIVKVRDLCGQKLGCIVGVGVSSTAKACSIAKFAAETKADAILLATPPYVKPTQEGIIEHFRSVKAAFNGPIIAYNIPGRSCANIQPLTVARLVTEGLIVGIKDATGSIEQLIDTVKLIGTKKLIGTSSIAILSGEDSLVHSVMSCGGVGTISATANVIPKEMSNLTSAYLGGKIEEALKIQLDILPVVRTVFTETNPIAVKAILAHLGVIAFPTVRLPLTRALETTVQKIKEVFPR